MRDGGQASGGPPLSNRVRRRSSVETDGDHDANVETAEYVKRTGSRTLHRSLGV